jgi:hypothetical protein
VFTNRWLSRRETLNLKLETGFQGEWFSALPFGALPPDRFQTDSRQIPDRFQTDSRRIPDGFPLALISNPLKDGASNLFA